MSSNSYSIANILGTVKYNDVVITNIFKNIDLSNINTNLDYFDEYKITNNDRWDLISTKFYGTPFLWWMLAAFNNVQDPFAEIKSLEQIKIIKKELIPTILLQLKGYI
jgi:hypothetical protein